MNNLNSCKLINFDQYYSAYTLRITHACAYLVKLIKGPDIGNEPWPHY